MSKPTNEIAATRATLDNIMTVAPYRARWSSRAGVVARHVPVPSPKIDPKATRFERLTHSQALDGGYKVMDATAFALARETAMPIIVASRVMKCKRQSG